MKKLLFLITLLVILASTITFTIPAKDAHAITITRCGTIDSPAR